MGDLSAPTVTARGSELFRINPFGEFRVCRAGKRPQSLRAAERRITHVNRVSAVGTVDGAAAAKPCGGTRGAVYPGDHSRCRYERKSTKRSRRPRHPGVTHRGCGAGPPVRPCGRRPDPSAALRRRAHIPAILTRHATARGMAHHSLAAGSLRRTSPYHRYPSESRLSAGELDTASLPAYLTSTLTTRRSGRARETA
jgi:hypothetical protein